MVYRPTVRYDDLFKVYVDQIFKATSLDRNQIIRLALFSAPFSPLFQHQIKKHMTSPLPSACWEVTDHGLWMEQTYNTIEEGKDVNGDNQEIFSFGVPQEPGETNALPGASARREREIYEQKVIRQSGGITIKIG